MGRLKELWAELRSLDKNDPRREEVQKRINETEQFCIDHGYAGFTSITKWNNGKVVSDEYPQNTGYVYLEDIDKVYKMEDGG